MYCSDLNMTTLKAGGAASTQSTKLMLPHEMLASANTQSVMHTGGHSTTTTLLALNPNSTSFFTTSSTTSSSTAAAAAATAFLVTNNHHHSNHNNNFQSSFSNFTNTNSNNTTGSSSSNNTADFRGSQTAHQSQAAAATTTATSSTMHNHSTSSTTISNNNTTTTTSTSSSSSTRAPLTDFVEQQQQTIKTENAENKDDGDNSSSVVNGVVDNCGDSGSGEQGQQQEEEPEPEIDIVISNVVCSFSVRCHLNLRTIALKGFNVEFRRENGMVTMKLRRPYTTASIWSSGRITCTGATSEDMAKIAARKYARCLQKLGFRVRFHNFRIVNVLGTCSMPWAIKITQFSEKYRRDASYEPELHPGVTYKLKEPKATLKIFSTGSITVTAASVAFVQQAIEHIFPLVYEFRKKRSPEEEKIIRNHAKPGSGLWSAETAGCSGNGSGGTGQPTEKGAAAVDDEDDDDEHDSDDAGRLFDELIEVDEEFNDDIENPSAKPSSSTANEGLSFKRRKFPNNFSQAKKKRRRPAGKASNDPQNDIMQVSDVDEYDLSDDDL